MPEPDMMLPAGKTCSDCVHFRRCKALIGEIAANTNCDWSPSRFLQSAASVRAGERLRCVKQLRARAAELVANRDRLLFGPEWRAAEELRMVADRLAAEPDVGTGPASGGNQPAAR